MIEPPGNPRFTRRRPEHRVKRVGPVAADCVTAHVHILGHRRVGVAEDVGDLACRQPGLIEQRRYCPCGTSGR